MKGITILLLLCCLTAVCHAGYELKWKWIGGELIDGWNWFAGKDPTHGFVKYVTKEEAQQFGMISVERGKAVIRSESNHVADDNGRRSIRLHSPMVFTKGIILFDCEHMPIGLGNWPAFWSTQGRGWPVGGEIDIIEGVNDQKVNQMTLHTPPGCFVPTAQTEEWGHHEGGDCQGFIGCAVKDVDEETYGEGFNRIQGGVFATQWEDSGIYIWFFKRNHIPDDIRSDKPDPSKWGKPRARFTFNQGCDGKANFWNHYIILDNTFCGDWAGAVYPGGPQACINHVRNNPGAFKEAYWVINYVKVFQQ